VFIQLLISYGSNKNQFTQSKTSNKVSFVLIKGSQQAIHSNTVKLAAEVHHHWLVPVYNHILAIL